VTEEPRSHPFDGLLGRFYDAYIKRPVLARPIGRVLWGASVEPMYRVMGAIAEAPDGSTILDAPCGGGLAFSSLRPDQDVRYLALDISDGMLDRARREARELGVDEQVELFKGDVQRMPFADATADLTLSMNSLHCVPDPAGAVVELARCTKPGAPFVGSTIVLGAGGRQDRLLKRGQRDGSIGPAGTAADLESWLRAAGLEDVQVEASGAIALFRARSPERTRR
jgi:SAM-dependent methyltransferase